MLIIHNFRALQFCSNSFAGVRETIGLKSLMSSINKVYHLNPENRNPEMQKNAEIPKVIIPKTEIPNRTGP